VVVDCGGYDTSILERWFSVVVQDIYLLIVAVDYWRDEKAYKTALYHCRVLVSKGLFGDDRDSHANFLPQILVCQESIQCWPTSELFGDRDVHSPA
jgi:hypothetical protein